MKILFLTDNFPPEVNAPATRTFEHCKEWVKLGADVTVITGAPNFPTGKVYRGYKNRLYQKEFMDGIKVIRVWTFIAANKGTIKRTLDYISFRFSAVFAGLFESCDLIIGTTPQFFTALAARRLAKIKKKPWVMEVRDIWPESIKVVEAVKDGAVMRYLEKKERQCYDSAQSIVCVTQGIHDRLLSRGIPKNKLKVMTNGANLELYRPKQKDTGLLEKLGLSGKKVIGYIGTMGMAHKLDFILKSAANITDPNIHFLLIGEGAEKENLLLLKDELALKNVTILDAVPKHEVADYLSIIDIALVNLKKTDLFLGALPSKIFENAAMEKPILLGLKGEAEKVINTYKAGIAFEPENENDLIEKIYLLAKNSEFYMRCVEGCRKLAKDYNRETIAKNMLDHIEKLDG
jgi:glycosyltransferase involved in cell wall biosynthesis